MIEKCYPFQVFHNISSLRKTYIFSVLIPDTKNKNYFTKIYLQKLTSSLLLLWSGSRCNNSANCFVKNVFQSLLCQSGAFQIFDRVDLFGFGHSLFVGNWCKSLFSESFDGVTVFSQIELCSDENQRCIWAVVRDFRVPFGRNVFEGSR